ncbi:hypothetical protein C8R45DRAFT_920225 [Mycena sanguinolenta]|nr:hypothetical protein C8R45DRAFT_920225 [Mycena sanguinolenta]
MPSPTPTSNTFLIKVAATMNNKVMHPVFAQSFTNSFLRLLFLIPVERQVSSWETVLPSLDPARPAYSPLDFEYPSSEHWSLINTKYSFFLEEGAINIVWDSFLLSRLLLKTPTMYGRWDGRASISV